MSRYSFQNCLLSQYSFISIYFAYVMMCQFYYIFVRNYNLEMETGPYLTEVTLNKDNECSQQKFQRCILPSSKNINTEEQFIKMPKITHLAHKNINNFLPEDYYTVKKVKPGIGLYKVILETEELRKTDQNLPYLKINIPYTLALLENSHELIYSEKGIVKVKSETNIHDFLKIVNQNKGESRTDNSNIYPAALTGVGSGIYTDFSIILSNQLDMRLFPKNQNQISQKFIKPFSNTPNMLRLFYTPKSIRNAKPNYAYKGTNKKKIGQQILERKHKQLHHYLVDYTKVDDIVVTLVRGKALQDVQHMAQSIIEYLQAIKKIKISQIVVDFIMCQDHKYYFHQLHSIRSTNLHPSLTPQTPQEQCQNYKQKINQINCRLCTYSFPKCQIKHRVTNKLIIQLYLHLKNRGEYMFMDCQNKNNKINNLSGFSYTCDLCYQLIVAENKLINLENQFTMLLNVRPKEIIRLGEGVGGKSGLGLGVEETHVYQWRMFFYLQKIKNIPLQQFGIQGNFMLNMKFNDFKQCFNKKFQIPEINTISRPQSCIPRHSETKRSFFAKSRNQKKSTLHTTASNRSHTLFLRENMLDFQKVKLITFYTKTEDISQILLNQELCFDLSCPSTSNGRGSVNGVNSFGVNGNKRYRGQSSTLQNFSNKKDCQRHSCEVLLFGSQYQYCNLQLSVGIVCDGKVSTQGLRLQRSSKDYLFYSSDQGLQNCSPLPPEWIQVISQGLDLNKENESNEMSSSRENQQQKAKILQKSQSSSFLGGWTKKKNKKSINKVWKFDISEDIESQKQEYL